MSSEKGGERRCSTLESSAMAFPLLDLPPGPTHPFHSQSSMFSSLASFTALLNGKQSDEEVKGCSSAQLQHQLSWESHDLSPPTNPNQFNGDDEEEDGDDDVGCTERSEMEVSSKVSSSAMPNNIMMGSVSSNPMMEGNLLRYNSAPSSMMDFRDKFFSHTTPASFTNNNNNNGLCQLNPKPFPQRFKPRGGSSIEEMPQSVKHLRPIMHHPSPPPPPPSTCKVVVGGTISHGSLSAVLEDGEEDTKYRQIARNELGGSSVSSSSVDFAALPPLRSGLIRHSSSPAGLISRVTSEIGDMRNPSSNGGGVFSGGGGQGPLPGGGQPFVGISPGFAMGGCFGSNREVNPDLNSGVLLQRMDSCPAEFSSRGGGGGGLEVPTLNSTPASSESLVDRRGFNRGGGGGGRSGFLGSFPVASWEDAVLANGNLLHGMHDGSSSINLKKRELSQLDQNMSARSLFQRDVYDSGLGGTNQFTLTSGNSLGRSSSSPEKLLSDCTPCQARAKRGCATHPRSIAERVRRTKITERMKKLQELVPNMDKQTNTAEMLDEVVDYVKSLQQEVKELREKASQCDGSCQIVKTDSSS